jgi:hypothetical protein
VTASDKPLKLLAQTAEDVPVISAALQDAAGQLGDFRFEAAARRFTLALNRYRWERPGEGRGERVRAGLQIGGVTAARSHRLKQGAEDAVVNLLALSFDEGEAPGGVLTLTFSGGGALALEVECIDIALADLTRPWRARGRPDHAGGGEADA